MTITTTATVQTLAAEVRVLQVGSRQVTMSVFKQLDFKPLDEVDVLGRVKLPTKDGDTDIHLVGRLRTTGALVRVCVPQPRKWRAWAPSSYCHWLDHRLYRGLEGNNRKTWPVISRDGDTLTWHYGEPGLCTVKPFADTQTAPVWDAEPDGPHAIYRWLNAEHDHRRLAGEFCDLGALEDDWRWISEVHFAEIHRSYVDFAAAQAQPLIVLAGLR